MRRRRRPRARCAVRSAPVGWCPLGTGRALCGAPVVPLRRPASLPWPPLCRASSAPFW